jgi:hypothetical protein
LYTPLHESQVMKSLANLGNRPAGEPLLADDVLELHAARLLLLIAICGKKKKATGLRQLDGLTKLAKLDFLIRYPEFFRELAKHLGHVASTPVRTIESSMVRYHYGPWDDRYYHILSYLEGKGLLKVTKSQSTYEFGLSELGTLAAAKLADSEEFRDLVQHMETVQGLVGKMAGNALKELIYEVFGREVVDLKLGEPIR